MQRCEWAGNDPLYVTYHDEEWGVPVHDESKHFEFLVLEGAQAGLSWLTILKRRDGYRRVFRGFDPAKVAVMTQTHIEDALQDPGIIRNRQKVQAAVINAGVFLEIQREFGSFDNYIWKFVGGKPVINGWKFDSEIPATSDVSDKLSADLKKRGMKFVGSTIIYAHLQATGLVNDHVVSCFRYKQLTKS
jgi:DNA-3-methyladenine glycosylase I